ncbi:MAG: hypothetical protein PF542_00075 [Nanoarchaeota archaeon]|jgi:hypothetical protein|nr:hypothetical protein [Nanoarchaeota archaeon]
MKSIDSDIPFVSQMFHSKFREVGDKINVEYLLPCKKDEFEVQKLKEFMVELWKGMIKNICL